MPKANIKDRSPLKTKKEIFDASTTYANQCKTAMDDNLAAKGHEMRERTKQFGARQRRGNLASNTVLPFQGQSTNKLEFSKGRSPIQIPKKCTPFDMLLVPHDLHMKMVSENHKEFHEK
mmetsp:Transcript_23623/g.32181  ORF Transcript_23623/g.32181 Transcript_23623/m.32181 type:complete len:119 (-) Transcript_23623:173-529(-)